MKIPLAKIENFVGDLGTIASAWLDAEGGRLLATNGHMGIRVSVAVDADDRSGLIPVEAFELARKELKAITKVNGKDQLPDPWLKIVCHDDTVFIQNLLTNTTHLVPRKKLSADDQPFPAVDKVFPKLKGKPSITLSADYLAEIANSLEGGTLSLWVSADDKVVVLASSGPSAVAVMPMKVNIDANDVNQRGIAQKQQAAAAV